MELEELKNTWSLLDERLKKQEVLKENIMKEILHTKSDKALSRLLNYEVLGMVILLLVIPVIIYALDFHPALPVYKTFMFCMLIITFLFLGWVGVKIYGLMHINFSKPVNINIEYTNKYNIQIRKEKQVMIFLVPVILIFCFYLYAQLKVNISLWAFLICMSVGAVLFTIWSYKKLYNKNISSILKSLEELKELKEE